MPLQSSGTCTEHGGRWPMWQMCLHQFILSPGASGITRVKGHCSGQHTGRMLLHHVAPTEEHESHMSYTERLGCS